MTPSRILKWAFTLILCLMWNEQSSGQDAPWTDLLQSIKTDQNVVSGEWKKEGSRLTIVSGTPARMRVPVTPKGPYKLDVEFDRPVAGDAFVLYLPVGDRCAMFIIRNDDSGIDMLGDKRAWENKTAGHGKYGTAASHKLQASVEPSGDAVKIDVTFDGKPLVSWQGAISALSLRYDWEMPKPFTLGLGSWNTVVHVTRFRYAGETNAVPSNSGERPAAVEEKPKLNPVAVQVNVASRSASTQPDIATTQTFDEGAIERPQYLNSPKSLIKTLTSVTSMMVIVSNDGAAHGSTSDIIATIPPDSRSSDKSGIGFAIPDGDDAMRRSFEEAIRAVTLRYPIWEPGQVNISFGERFVTHGGPSAGTAFAVLALSALEGFSIDPKCAVTGDMTVDWKVRKIGGTTAKLRGAALDKCLYAAIPAENEGAFADLPILFGHSALWDIQVFSIATLQDAVALVRTDRHPELTEAMVQFASLQPELTKSETNLRKPETQAKLKKIVELAPNHLSAKYLLALSDGTASKTLSKNATLHELSVIFFPFRQVLKGKGTLNRESLPAYVSVQARKKLTALRPIASKELQPLIVDISAFVSALDDFVAHPGSNANVLARAHAVDARFAQLDSDPDFFERMIREGY